MKRYLQIDGGGIKGVIPAVIMAAVEKKYGPVASQFDLICGSSTGAIIGGCAAAGVPMSTVADLYLNSGRSLFTPRSKWNPANWLRERYDRHPFQRVLIEFIGRRKMCDSLTKYMATAFNLVTNQTTFLKSWKPECKNVSMVDAISWSALSAAYYFGKICVPDFKTEYVYPNGKQVILDGSVFQDGGQGISNCTLSYVLTEILAADEENVFVLSLGCGSAECPEPYAEAAKTKFAEQIAKYPFQARAESTESQVQEAVYVAKHRPGINVLRLDCRLPKAADELDAVDFIDLFKKEGEALSMFLPDKI